MTNATAVAIMRTLRDAGEAYEPAERHMIGVHGAITRAVAECVRRDGVTEREAFGRHVRELFNELPRVAVMYLDWLRRMADAATRGPAAGAK